MYQAITEPRTPHPRDHFRMSSFGQCLRAQVAERAGLPILNPFDRRVAFKLWVGTVIHTAWQTELTKIGFLDPAWTEREVRYRSYVGHVDGLTHCLPGGDCLVECKTADDSAVTKPDWPAHYLWQDLLYCVAAGIPRCLIQQLGKSQGLSRERVLILTDEWRAKINMQMDMAEEAWAAYAGTGTLPVHGHQFPWEDRTCPQLSEDDKTLFHPMKKGVKRA